jgi:4-aminobutyrate aminotransferase-like enzyme
MTPPLQLPDEPRGNRHRAAIAGAEPRSLRTFTPTQAVIAHSAGVYHWTADGRRLFDYTSGVLVANLGHNPTGWLDRFARYMGWHPATGRPQPVESAYTPAVPLTAYNAVTPIEAEASRRLVRFCQGRPGGQRLEQVLWAASGAEAILATRYGFHGKKGLAGAVTGSEADAERDPRVRFISFPMAECRDLSLRDAPFDPAPYRAELDALWHQFGAKLGTLITEPYLGGGGSYHPPAAYLQLLDRFCRDRDLVFILDEVQANFGRTGKMFAYETYGLSPDVVVLGKGLGNGVPVAAAVGRADLFDALGYGEASDTWSANPLSCAAVAATLDEFEGRDILGPMREASAVIERGLVKLNTFPFVAHVRGEKGGMVWGVETADHAGRTAAEWANGLVLEAYRGDAGGDGVHLLGPLAKKVIRISPPLVITPAEASAAGGVLHRACERLVGS